MARSIGDVGTAESSSEPARLATRLAAHWGASWRFRGTVGLSVALAVGYGLSCATAGPEPTEPPVSPQPPSTVPDVAVAQLGPHETDTPLLPVLNEAALTARVVAQRSLLGGDLFEDVRGRPVPWISPQNAPPNDEVVGLDGDTKIDDTLLDSLPGSSGLGGSSIAAGHGATEPTTEQINGNALGLFVPIEGPNEGDPPLMKFYQALEDLRTGQDPDGKVRVLVYGGSHTDADVYPHYLRTYLQERFGDGGHGYVQVARPWRWYRHIDYYVDGAKYWRTQHAQRRKYPQDGYYGLAGVSVAASTKRAFGRVVPRNDHAVGSIYELYFLTQPEGGSFKVLADGKKIATVKTEADDFGPGYHRFVLPEGKHEIEIKLLGNGEVRLFGMTIEREQPGVVVDTLGIGGTRAANMLEWDETIWADNVAKRDPDLVVMFYGTNEATDENQPIETYENDLTAALERLMGFAPHASCLLMGPGDFPRQLDDGTWVGRPRVDEIIEVQRRVAIDHGCGFWDAKAFMGGDLSMTLWASSEPTMAKSDHIHFTKRGYVRLGMGLVDAMMVGYDGGMLARAD